jgi:hypothetical protein
MRYAAYLLQVDDSYRDLELTVEADDPRQAAQRVFDQLTIAELHPDELFPQLIVVPEAEVSVFTRNDEGRAVTLTEDLPRLIAKAPRTGTVTFYADGIEESEEL